MTIGRRTILSAACLSGASLAALSRTAAAGTKTGEARAPQAFAEFLEADPDSSEQTAGLQQALDQAALQGRPVHLAPGVFRISGLRLPSGTRLIGAGPQTRLQYRGGTAFIEADDAAHIEIANLTIDGAKLGLDANTASGLMTLRRCQGVRLRDLIVTASLLNGLTLEQCSGTISGCTISEVLQAGLFSIDGQGIDIRNNRVLRCANNGIQVWRSAPGEDGTLVTGNRIEHIEAKAGGSGQNGNGINVFRADGVLVTANRISDCAYSAIRANAASNIQMVANSCTRIGEVALYAEFGFQGALIASNIVDGAASGIAVTNFNDGGRLAVVQGNLIRNLVRREFEATDKRGVGISVEADSLVTGNTIEEAASAGIQIGWGRYMRDCSATQNLIRNAEAGILVSANPEAGQCLIAHNTISGVKRGAIRAMDDAGEPFGPELARDGRDGERIKITGNLSA